MREIYMEEKRKEDISEDEKTNFDMTEDELQFEGLHCTNCARKIEEEINDLSYIENADLNFANSTIKVRGKNNIKSLEEIKNIVDRIEPGVKVNKKSNKEKSKDKEEISSNKNNRYLHKLIAGGLIFVFALLTDKLDLLSSEIPFHVSWFAYGISYIIIGSPVLLAAYKNIKNRSFFDENFLMIIATLGAFGVREFPEAVAVMLFYMIGEIFQNKAVNHSRKSIKELMNLKPDYAWIKRNDTLHKVDPENVETGDIIVIKTGEKVPLDGIVRKGSSMLDTSALTGESTPRSLKKGDEILAGMINKEGSLEVEVTKQYNDSIVAKILELVENASSRKAPTEKFITKFSRYYTPVVVYTAIAITFIPPLFFTGASFGEWFYRALIFLVVSCPCALVVSVPLGFFGGIGKASRQGVLVKGGNYLEALNNVNTVVFDKTGTLTKGEFSVNKIEAVNDFEKEYILKLSAHAENRSTHPVARAIVDKHINTNDAKINESWIQSYKEISGKGIKAVVNGQKVLVGSKKLMIEAEVKFEEVKDIGTVIYIAINNQFAGYLLISDRKKEGSFKTIKKLQEMGKDIVMLTGDRENTAQRIASNLNIDNYYSDLLPDQKVSKVESLITKAEDNSKLAFVGDGINDAPVLARSDLGIAMGGLGSDAAIEAADIVLMDDKPEGLIKAFETAKKTRKIVRQNIILALGVKFAVLALGVFGLATMWEAVFADVGVALLAVMNSMRILKITS